MMEINRAIHKLDFMRSAYQKLIDEKVDEGRFVGTDVTGTWKANTTLNDAYKEHIEALTLAISAMKKQEQDRWIPVTERLPEPVTERTLEDEYVLISKKPTKLSGSKWSVAIAIRTADPRSGKIQWRDSGFGIIQDDKVLAWRPLPAPYKEDEA